ncbi:hypothetical protein [Desulfurobacterium crinifex]
MKRLLTLLTTAFLFSCGSSGYIASEYSSRSVLAGKPTVKPIQAPIAKQTTTQLGASVAVSLVGGALLGKWANAKKQELLRKYYAICMIEHNLSPEWEEGCSLWASDELREVIGFLHRLKHGKCTEKWFGIFKGFRKCYAEAVNGVKDLHVDWKNEVKKILYYDKLSDCLPDPADVKTDEELLDKYSSCKVEAERYVKEEYPKIMEKAGYK